MMKLEVKFRYLSHRDKIEDRHILFNRVEFLSAPGFGYAPGWFVRGQDFDREMADRSFALDRIIIPAQSASGPQGAWVLFSLAQAEVPPDGTDRG